MNKAPRLSLCMIVKNEEEILPRCLKSVSSLVDEIIIVDTGSTDLTLSVAKDFGAQTFAYVWDDSFSNARNYSLEQASGNWILVLDADEILVCNGTKPLKSLLEVIGTEAYFIRIVSLLGERYEIETSEDLVIRLFRNRPEYRFYGSIHEQVYPSVLNFSGTDAINNAPLTIYHDGYRSETIQMKNRVRRNLQVIEKALTLNPHDPFLSPFSPELLFLSGLVNLESGNLIEAEKNIRECLQKLPVNQIRPLNIRRGQVYQALGDIYQSKRLWNEAVKFYFNAIEATPQYLYPLQKLINLYKRREPELPIEELLGFCPPKNRCLLLMKINWQTDEDIALFLIFGLARDIWLSDWYVSQLLEPEIVSVLNEIQQKNTGTRATAAIHLAKAVILLVRSKNFDSGAATQTCPNLLQNIREILLLST